MSRRTSAREDNSRVSRMMDDRRRRLHELAQTGDDVAQFQLGELYEFAAVTTETERARNRQHAMSCYHAAAKRGHPDAILRYGLGCERGYLGHQEAETAFLYYTKATRFGNIRAHYEMGRCFEFGIGTEVDRASALHKYRVAIELIEGVIKKMRQGTMPLVDLYAPDLNELNQILKKAKEAVENGAPGAGGMLEEGR